MHPQHRAALKGWSAKPEEISYVGSRTIGESTFKTALREGWIERRSPVQHIRWYEGYYRLTDKGRELAATL